MQQLKENEFLRELFDLGPPAPPVTSDERISKAHRVGFAFLSRSFLYLQMNMMNFLKY